MRVLVVPEDPVQDRYILKPLVERLCEDLGRPSARVHVLENPRLRGVTEALSGRTLADIARGPRYAMFDLILVLVDRDGDVMARPALAAKREREHPNRLFVCLAIEEIEVWMLACHHAALGVSWRELRAERQPKRAYAEPFLAENAPKGSPGRGRAWAMRALDRTSWRTLLDLCPELEDVKRKILPSLA